MAQDRVGIYINWVSIQNQTNKGTFLVCLIRHKVKGLQTDISGNRELQTS